MNRRSPKMEHGSIQYVPAGILNLGAASYSLPNRAGAAEMSIPSRVASAPVRPAVASRKRNCSF